MNHPCPYCSQTDTLKDSFGYCKSYNCLTRSGLRSKLNQLIKRASNLIMIPRSDFKQLGRVISQSYSVRNRAANDIMHDSVVTFGFVPTEVLQWIDPKDRQPWDRAIRW